MQTPRDTRDKLLKIAEPVCTGAGYELVDLRFVSEPGGWVVRVFIDHAPGTSPGTSIDVSIGFDDCERISRELSALFDVEDPVPHAYRLEVSSPGFDRPLRTADHFRRVVGACAKVALGHGVDGRRNFTGTVVGVDAGDDGAVVEIEVDGTRHRLPFDDIANAKLVPDWDRLVGSAPASGQ